MKTHFRLEYSLLDGSENKFYQFNDPEVNKVLMHRDDYTFKHRVRSSSRGYWRTANAISRAEINGDWYTDAFWSPSFLTASPTMIVTNVDQDNRSITLDTTNPASEISLEPSRVPYENRSEVQRRLEQSREDRRRREEERRNPSPFQRSTRSPFR